MVGVIVYKLLVIHPLYKNPNFQQYAATIVSVTGSMMNLIIIMILSKVSQQIRIYVILIYFPTRYVVESHARYVAVLKKQSLY